MPTSSGSSCRRAWGCGAALPQGAVKQPLVQILLVVANIRVAAVKTEVEQGSRRTAVGPGEPILSGSATALNTPLWCRRERKPAKVPAPARAALNNASPATPAGGRVEFSVRPKAAHTAESGWLAVRCARRMAERHALFARARRPVKSGGSKARVGRTDIRSRSPRCRASSAWNNVVREVGKTDP